MKKENKSKKNCLIGSIILLFLILSFFPAIYMLVENGYSGMKNLIFPISLSVQIICWSICIFCKLNPFKENFIKSNPAYIPLAISFLPYIFILIVAVISMFNGFDFFFSTSYGFEGFVDAIFIYGYLGIHFLILPVCWLIQIAYLITYIFFKISTSKSNFWHIVWIVVRNIFLLVIGVTVIIAIVLSFKNSDKQKLYKTMQDNAEVKIEYTTKNSNNGSVYVDYDENKIGFYINKTDYYEYNLALLDEQAEQNINEKFTVQAVVDLDGKEKIITFSEPVYKYQTYAVVVIKPNGEKLCCEDMRADGYPKGIFTGLRDSEYSESANNLKLKDIKVD